MNSAGVRGADVWGPDVLAPGLHRARLLEQYRLHEGSFVTFVGLGDVERLRATLPPSHERWTVDEFSVRRDGTVS